MRVSDYIIEFLEKNGVEVVFTITGGFAMHMNDSFGRSKTIRAIYQHHEQACGYSAVGYSKTTNKPSVVCTTAGVAATNAISTCLVAHQDSVPVLFISGQTKSTETIRTLNSDTLKLRHYSGADCDIISMVSPITKFAYEVRSLDEVPQVFEKAFTEMISGRPGPVWISIPVDIQGFTINHIPLQVAIKNDIQNTVNLSELYTLSSKSSRPLLLVGNGVKLNNCKRELNEFLIKNRIPCVFTILSSDLVESSNELNIGKVGLIGDRHGNFAMQNCDLLISLGCRMAQGIVGYRADWFSRDSKKVMIDIDANELNKEKLDYDLKYNINIADFFRNFQSQLPDISGWIEKCNHWKSKWLFETPPINVLDKLNPYIVLKEFYDLALPDKITVTSSGSINTNVWHMLNVKENDKYITSGQGDMGFEIPASIGAQIGFPTKNVVAILGEGSFQLNLQELQTILQYKLPIKILLFNNASYGAIEITQSNFFNTKFGVDVESGISFPDTGKISNAYGIEYKALVEYGDIQDKLNYFLQYNGPIILEVFCCVQSRYPRVSAIKKDDGTFENRPLEDMSPFLDRDEFEEEMLVKIV
jgi:acetolactate synthase-1/2/3 large subunit